MKTLSCPALLLAVSLASAAWAGAPAPAAAPEAVPFMENDYAGALAKARAQGVPVFVDVWAPW